MPCKTMASALEPTIFRRVEGTLDISLMQNIPNLEQLLSDLKKQHDITFVKSEMGFDVKGNLNGLNSLESAIMKRIVTAPKAINIWYKKGETNFVEDFLNGQKLGYQNKNKAVQSRTNVYFQAGVFCYLLLDKKDELSDLLFDEEASIGLKHLNENKIRVCIEKVKPNASKVELDIRDLCEASVHGMKEINVRAENLYCLENVLEEIKTNVKPTMFLTRQDTKTPAWLFSLLVTSARKEKAEEKLKHVISKYSSRPLNVKEILTSFCEHRLPTASHPTATNSAEKETQTTLPYFDTIGDGDKSPDLDLRGRTAISKVNKDMERRSKHSVGHMEVKKEVVKGVPDVASGAGVSSPVLEERSIQVGDEDVIDYLLKFRKDELQKIQTDYSAKVDFSRKGEGIILLFTEPRYAQEADLKMSHLAQDIFFEQGTLDIDLIRVKADIYKANHTKAICEAEKLLFIVKPDKANSWHIIGPKRNLKECANAIRTCFGISSRRKLLASSIDSSFSTTHLVNASEEHALSLPPSVNKPAPQAYCKIDGHVWTYAWVTDITKLRVDVIVNAANEHLVHGAGVAYVIAKAAGYQLEEECQRYRKNYGKVKVSDGCLTTAGNTRAVKVWHAVGPRWDEYRDKNECIRLLFETFYNCLCRANKNGYVSIAIPAVSSGIFGVPKEHVARNAICAVVYFCKQFPSSKLKHIHLVDIQHDIIMLYQRQLEEAVHKGIFSAATSYSDFSYWVEDKPRSKATRVYDRNPQNFPQTKNGPKTDATMSTNRSHSRGFERTVTTTNRSQDKTVENENWEMLSSNNLAKNLSINSTSDTISHQKDPKLVTSTKHTTTFIEGLNKSYAKVLTGEEQKKTEIPDVHGGVKQRNVSKLSKENLQNERKMPDGDTLKSNENTKESDDDCSICMEKPTKRKTLPLCKHTFCQDCIDRYFEIQPKCPNCGLVYGELKGIQPENGTMDVREEKSSLPGYSGYGTLVIYYRFPNGIQTDKHPNPGKPYHGTSRVAYLPDCKEGKEVLGLLRRAFAARMVFTVGTSSTTGKDDCVIWNCIHHKTSKSGGSQGYGYPDPTYLSRVREELAAQGFK